MESTGEEKYIVISNRWRGGSIGTRIITCGRNAKSIKSTTMVKNETKKV